MAKKTPEAKQPPTFGFPGAFAVARNQAGGDWAAAVFLYRIKFRWQMKNKLARHGLEWVAMSREEWAKESGLTFGEFKNRALPKLRQQPFVTINQWKLKPNGPKRLWVNLDPDWLDLCTTPLDMDPIQTGMIGPGQQGDWTEYPYKKNNEDPKGKSITGKNLTNKLGILKPGKLIIPKPQK
jgi:hypothetical protein